MRRGMRGALPGGGQPVDVARAGDALGGQQLFQRAAASSR